MTDPDAVKNALRDDPKPSRRERRAALTRAKALSPLRILVQVLLVPFFVASATISIYMVTSPYERVDAMRHLLAMAGCDTAMAVGLAPTAVGGLGYHARNDPDGDGVACGPPPSVVTEAPAPAPVRPETGAKFLRSPALR